MQRAAQDENGQGQGPASRTRSKWPGAGAASAAAPLAAAQPFRAPRFTAQRPGSVANRVAAPERASAATAVPNCAGLRPPKALVPPPPLPSPKGPHDCCLFQLRVLLGPIDDLPPGDSKLILVRQGRAPPRPARRACHGPCCAVRRRLSPAFACTLPFPLMQVMQRVVQMWAPGQFAAIEDVSAGGAGRGGWRNPPCCYRWRSTCRRTTCRALQAEDAQEALSALLARWEERCVAAVETPVSMGRRRLRPTAERCGMAGPTK